MPLQSTHSLEFILPGSIIFVTIIYDVLSTIHFPKSCRTTLSSLASPFQNFVTVDDLENVNAALPLAVWKARTLSFLALGNSLGWMAYFVYACVVQDNIPAVEALSVSVTWVSNFIPHIYPCI
jgi:hypothetical protein